MSKVINCEICLQKGALKNSFLKLNDSYYKCQNIIDYRDGIKCMDRGVF